MKKTILHIIYNLGRGGAETMLVSVLKELTEYNNILVTFDAENHFGEELQADKHICLNTPSTKQFPLAAVRLRKVIRKYRPDLVHTHLFWPTIIARIVTPKKIPLITTIHAFIATSVEYRHRHIKWLDKLTYHLRKSIIITVAKGALNEYFSFLRLKPYKAYMLHTFVDVRRFNEANALPGENSKSFRIMTSGALREQKNHKFLVTAFKELNGNFELHIYGSGPLHQKLSSQIKESRIENVVLEGEVKNINEIIRQYDLFVMSSTFEGFSLSVLEAMALKMPILLSDISSFREQCEDTAVYFDLNSTTDFINKLKQLSLDNRQLQTLGEKAKQRVLANFTIEHHMKGLRSIYRTALVGQ